MRAFVLRLCTIDGPMLVAFGEGKVVEKTTFFG